VKSKSPEYRIGNEKRFIDNCEKASKYMQAPNAY